jgi:DNA invertase Pin-like site-specific DNA recombinase
MAGLEAQVAALKKAGCKKIFQEQVSSVAHRDQLEAAIEFMREGDKLVVTKLDRLARSVSDYIGLEERLRNKGAATRVLDLELDTATASGKLTLNVFMAVAQFEREIMLERQREGVAKAKAAGKYKGRKPTARAKAEEIRRLAGQGLGASAIARQLAVGRSSVYRMLGTSARAKDA